MRRDDRLERVRRESKQTQDKLDHATHLSRKLTDDVDAIANNISMALRMAPAHYHHGNAKQERLARIDSILNRLDEPLPPASRPPPTAARNKEREDSKRRRRRKISGVKFTVNSNKTLKG